MTQQEIVAVARVKILFALMALAMVVALLFQGCAAQQRQTQAVVIDVVARTVNAALPKVAAAYQAEGDRLIDSATSADEARAKLAEHRKRWAPIWVAWDRTSDAQGAYAALLEAQAQPDAAKLEEARGALLGAYCGLRGSAPSAALPEVPGMPCPAGGAP